MPGVFYLILCLLTGRSIVKQIRPEVCGLGEKSFRGAELRLPRFLSAFPVYYLVGIMTVTWCTYIFASLVMLLRPAERYPLHTANICVFFMAILFDLACIFMEWHAGQGQGFREALPAFRKWKHYVFELFFFTALTIFFGKLMYGTFRIEDGKLRIGFSVFSDFAVHMGMIRSFSFGNNFPTQYSHYAGQDVRYHFMFQFLVGNLEFLGMRIDHAMNVTSILSLLSACMLLYVYAAKLFSGRAAGALSVVFMLFRSSPSLFRSLSEQPVSEEFWENVKTRDYFMNYTPNEDWGLWSLKVYTNQRHLAFGMTGVFLLLLLYTPLVFRMFKKLRSAGTDRRGRWRMLLAEKEAFLPESVPRAVFGGLVLGAMAFWNGAMVIGALCILFVMALVSAHRLEYLLTAAIAMVLSLLQTQAFISGNAVAPEFFYGFIVENKTFWGVSMYLLDLTGLLLILGAIAFLHYRGGVRWLLVAFSAPLLLAFHVSLTPDVMVNHKYIMLSIILISVILAGFLQEQWEKRDMWRRAAVVVLCIILTATGIYEVRVQQNVDEEAFSYALDDDLIAWVRENASSKDLWLTDWISIHEVVLGGAMLYYGWPYYAWSAGYDTYGREAVVAELFSESDPARMRRRMAEEGIRYIMVDSGVRHSENYEVREDVIAGLYPVVYECGEGDWRMTIYDTAGTPGGL